MSRIHQNVETAFHFVSLNLVYVYDNGYEQYDCINRKSNYVN